MFWPFNKRTWKEHFDLGMAAGGASDIEGAVTHFREAVRLAPLEPYPHYELGYSLFLLGRGGGGVESRPYRACTNLCPRSLLLG